MQNKAIPFRAAIERHPLFLFIIAIIISALLPSSLLANADKIFKENNRAVVVVVTYNAKGEPISQGSGFIIRPDGAVITNYHVISNAVDIAVKAGDKVLKVEGLLHIDKENDLVILKAKGKDLPFVKIGDIGKMNIGEKVYVISSPEGLENTISDGILSGIREITSERKILQITAPISPGSSGGPVFNKNGEVIGIATFIIKEAQNLNFAMPVNVVKDKISNKKITVLKDSKIEDYKKTAEYWYNRGYSFYETGLYREAIEAFKQAIRIKPDVAGVHNNLGIAYDNLGMFREAIDAYMQAIRIKPDYAKAHYNLGIAYDNLGKLREAMDAFKQAIRIKPDYAEAHGGIGNAYSGSGMYREAIESFKQAIRIKPDLAEVHNNLGIAYVRLGMYRVGIESYKQAIRIKPDYANAHHNLGAAYVRLGMHSVGIESYKQAIRIKPDYAEAHNNLGAAYVELGMHREAIEAFKQAIRIKPDYAKAHYNLGIAYLGLNDRGSALEEYKILKTLNPDMANELFNLIYE